MKPVNKTDAHTPSPGAGMGERKDLSSRDARIIEKIRSLAEPLCDSEAIELVHVEYQREPAGRTLRIYIDKPGGVQMDDCVRISRQMDDLLDVYLDEVGPYHLEVSSPGADRPLGKAGDYQRFKGCRAKIRTHHPVDGRKNYTGILQGIAEGCVKIIVDNKIVAIPFEEIQKARLINYTGEFPCL